MQELSYHCTAITTHIRGYLLLNKSENKPPTTTPVPAKKQKH